MKKTHNLSKKEKQKRREKVFFGVLFAALILVAVLAIVEAVMPKEEAGMQYLVTGDGHVHTMDGQHVGSVEEFFGEGAMDNLVVTKDGHVHTADGTHVGNIAQVVEAPAEDAGEAAAQ